MRRSIPVRSQYLMSDSNWCLANQMCPVTHNSVGGEARSAAHRDPISSGNPIEEPVNTRRSVATNCEECHPIYNEEAATPLPASYTGDANRPAGRSRLPSRLPQFYSRPGVDSVCLYGGNHESGPRGGRPRTRQSAAANATRSTERRGREARADSFPPNARRSHFATVPEYWCASA